MTPSLAVRGCALAALFAALCLAEPASAQVQRNYLNPGFESPALTAASAAAGCYKLLSETLVPGWTTTHPVGADGGTCTAPVGPSGPQMEMWRTNFNGVPARSGSNFVELNASASSRMYQNVCVLNGDQIAWRFSHRGRGSAAIPDVMDYNIGASAPIVRVSTTSNGTFNPPIASQGTANAPTLGGNGWVDYTGSFTYAGATGTTSMGFESISAGSGNNTIGNFLDNIQIELRPFVEFVQTSSSTSENASSNVPTLRVNGTAFSPFTITVQIVGGSAALGTDYTTPGNNATMTITVPVGQYDGFSAASLFPLPIAVVDDALSEGNETIQLSIVPPTGSPPPFLLSSSATCGGAPQSASTYTVIDDDASIAVVKNAAAPVAVSGQPTQFDIAYTVAVSNPTLVTANYSLVDTPGFDPDTSIVSASFVLNGGASNALAGSGPWTLQPPSRALAGGATDTYIVTVRINVNRGGSVGNDACAVPSASGNGLHNAATATLQAAGNPTFVASACRDTPTPVWATLRKSLVGRALASDQMQVRIRSAGVVVATATTSGAALPATASTGTVVLPAGNTLQFEESVKANGTGPDQAPTAYRPQIACTNASAGSPTVLPTGAGNAVSTRQEWPAFATAAGDDIDCTITNALRSADLRLTKTNTPGANGDVDQLADTVISGTTIGYSITVSNLGPDAADGALVTDPAPTGLTCTTAACTAAGGATCPVATGAALVTALQGAGAAIPTLPNGGSVTIVLTCTVN
ncbi:MAG: DUF11 domain-containing protein [Lysobacter sp.]|nr:MAG: DUF11 domain-containing protein [Lysobacter sp.]